jgi:hypothetical protein
LRDGDGDEEENDGGEECVSLWWGWASDKVVPSAGLPLVGKVRNADQEI